MNVRRSLAAGAAAIALALPLAACGETSTSDTSTKEESGKDAEFHGVGRSESRSACHNRVKDQLVSPSSANFEGFTEGTWNETYRGVNFSGWVDAENGFGASIRSTYDCEVYYDGDDLMTSSPEIIQR
jgi:hypothetical protein